MSNVAYELVKRVLPSSKPENEFEVRAEKKNLLAVLEYSNHQNSEPIVKKVFLPNLLQVYGFRLRPWFKERSLFFWRSLSPIPEICQKATTLSFSHYRVSEAVDQIVQFRPVESAEKN